VATCSLNTRTFCRRCCNGGRPAFIMRLVLAALAGSTYGVYNGYELCREHPRLRRQRIHLDSEIVPAQGLDWIGRTTSWTS